MLVRDEFEKLSVAENLRKPNSYRSVAAKFYCFDLVTVKCRWIQPGLFQTFRPMAHRKSVFEQIGTIQTDSTH